MSDVAPIESVTIRKPGALHGADMSSILGYDHPCITCDYNLRGLAINAACPECNNPVIDSLRRKLLRHADPLFVRRLRNGARMISIAAILPIVGPIVLIPVLLLFSISTPGSSATFGFAIPLLLVVLIWASFLVGWIRLTSLDPATTSGSEFDGDRSSCRKMSIALCALPVLIFPVIVIMAMFTRITGMAGVVGVSVWTLAVLVVVVLQVRLSMRLVKRLAHRIPIKGLAKFATALYWVIMASIILTIVRIGLMALLFAPILANPPTPGGQSMMPVFSIVMMVVVGLISMLNFLVSLAGYGMYIGLFCWLWAQLSKTCRLNPVVQS